MADNPFFPLSFIAAPAILMNACAIMQNGTNIRYNLAVTQLRDFRSSIVNKDERMSSMYTDTDAVIRLAKRRVSLLLSGLNLLYSAVGVFGFTTFMCLLGAFLSKDNITLIADVTYFMIGAAGLGILLLLIAVLTFVRESSIARAMLKLHLQLG